MYTTPYNDINKDPQRTFESTLVVTRPNSSNIKQLLCYEIPGIVKTSFHLSIYENIDSEILFKVKAFKFYKTEVEKFPHPRSIKGIENLARHRGIESGLKNAEAFQLIRSINN